MIPNAASTALQYLSLTFPADQGRTRYNSLQQITVAAPLIHGSQTMRQRNDPYSTAPQDAHERDRLENVHPAGWRNPQPADRYSLVVVGVLLAVLALQGIEGQEQIDLRYFRIPGFDQVSDGDQNGKAAVVPQIESSATEGVRNVTPIRGARRRLGCAFQLDVEGALGASVARSEGRNLKVEPEVVAWALAQNPLLRLVCV